MMTWRDQLNGDSLHWLLESNTAGVRYLVLRCLLAQLGASIDQDERIGRDCAYLLDQPLTEDGQFTMSGAPSGTIDILCDGVNPGAYSRSVC